MQRILATGQLIAADWSTSSQADSLAWTSFAHFVGSVSIVDFDPRLGYASPGAITLSASFAGSTSGSTPDSPSSVGCESLPL